MRDSFGQSPGSSQLKRVEGNQGILRKKIFVVIFFA
jgi:hypothetical protein